MFDGIFESPLGSPLSRPIDPGGDYLTKKGLLLEILYPGMIDHIGLLITRSQVAESIADIFFDGETRRADSEIVILALASLYLNIPGGTLYGDADSGIVLYAIGLQPVESAERRLWRYLFGTIWEQMFEDGDLIFIDGQPAYEGEQ